VNEAEVAFCGFVIACSEAAGAFELVEASLHPVSQGVCNTIDEDGLLAIGLAGNDRCSATPGNHLPDVIAVIAAVGNEHPGRRKVVIHEHVEAFEVGDFTTAYLRPDRQSVSVGNEVDFGREATF
jgi:hypothetical protein